MIKLGWSIMHVLSLQSIVLRCNQTLSIIDIVFINRAVVLLRYDSVGLNGIMVCFLELACKKQLTFGLVAWHID